MTIVLFDIDGTLLTTAGAARAAFARALSEAAGRPVDPGGYSFSGRTDPQIARDILSAHGVEGPALEAAIPRAIGLYLRYFASDLASLRGARLMPGVTALLDALAGAPGVRTALLTGNVEAGARLKLGHFNLTSFFDFNLSCFGSDDADRYRLPALALARARRAFGEQFQGDQLVIIGDSEHDVLCGRSVGARAVAVCTGWTPADVLRGHGPHAVLDDLSETRRVVDLVLGAAS